MFVGHTGVTPQVTVRRGNRAAGVKGHAGVRAKTWGVGTCGSGIELTATGGGVCSCQTPGYTHRPCIGAGRTV